ncbi:MAG TPA: PIN domain-containing protein [Archangium sp.]|nr:PIN domain-containing protein [Archangium sp.]
MLTVCVETNFVLRLALQQEQWKECDRIVRAAEAGTFKLALPVLSLFEALSTLRRRREERIKQAEEWKRLARELDRTEHDLHKQSAARLVEASTQVRELLDRDREDLAKVTERLRQCSEIVPLDSEYFATAYERHERAGLKSADALILTSLLAYVQDVEGTCLFLTSDSDFGSSALVVKALEDVRVPLIHKAADLLQALGAQGIVLPQ